MVSTGKERATPPAARIGRPKKKTDPIESIRLTGAQREALEGLAALRRRSLSEVLRDAAREWGDANPRWVRAAQRHGEEPVSLLAGGTRVRVVEDDQDYTAAGFSVSAKLKTATRLAVVDSGLEKAAYWREEIVAPYLERHRSEVSQGLRHARKAASGSASKEDSGRAGRRGAAFARRAPFTMEPHDTPAAVWAA